MLRAVPAIMLMAASRPALSRPGTLVYALYGPSAFLWVAPRVLLGMPEEPGMLRAFVR